MDYKEAARSHEFNKKNGSISSLINKSTINSFEAGYEFCQKEYEEKLRWIPIKQRVPNENGRYLTKSNNGYINILSFKSNMWSTAGYQSDIEYWMPLSFL